MPDLITNKGVKKEKKISLFHVVNRDQEKSEFNKFNLKGKSAWVSDRLNDSIWSEKNKERKKKK